MALGGRDPNPGERGAHEDTRDGTQYHNRLVRGQLTPPNPEEGTVQVNTIEILGSRKVTVPALWFSANGRKTAWGRYMPQGGEFVDVLYRNDDTAEIVRYDINATKDTEPGWAEFRRFQKEDVVGYASFSPLKPGEFDFKSSGDAYIFGSAAGTLLLSGGQAFIKLDKQS